LIFSPEQYFQRSIVTHTQAYAHNDIARWGRYAAGFASANCR
jgi:hypothetical protein